MKVAFVCGPYREDEIVDVVRNIRRAELVAMHLWKKGYAVVCPHMNSALFDGLCSNEHFLAGTIEIMRRCDVVALMPNWEDHEGCLDEIREAERIGLEIIPWEDI